MNIIFFGSFQHYSTLILESLVANADINIVGVVTTPPKPAGRKQILTKTPVHEFAESHGIPVFTPEKLSLATLDDLNSKISRNAGSRSAGQNPKSKIDHFVVSGYGKLLPPEWLNYPKFGSLNLHFSLLPKFRGANPAEWAILLGETETGITLILMSEKFDTGSILAQASIPIDPKDTRETLYQKLYTLGAQKLPGWIIGHYTNPKTPGQAQGPAPTPYASRFTKDQSFIDWRILSTAMKGKPYDFTILPPYLKTAYTCLKLEKLEFGIWNLEFIARAVRALHGFPGLWTVVNTTKGDKRMKILSASLDPKSQNLTLISVQLEGLKPTPFNQIKNLVI